MFFHVLLSVIHVVRICSILYFVFLHIELFIFLNRGQVRLSAGETCSLAP